MIREETADFSDADADWLIDALRRPDAPQAGVRHLAGKLDHLVHAMDVSGRLSALSSGQVRTILYALRRAGHNVVDLEGATYNQDGLATIHSAEFLRDPGFASAYARGVAVAGVDHAA